MANIAERNIIFRIQTDTAKARKDIESVKKDVTGLNGVVRNAAANFAGLAAFDIAGRLTGGLRSLTDQSIKLALASEQTTVAFETFLGSAGRARQVLAELREFSTLTPFEPDQVIQAGKALLAFGIEADNLTDTLKTIGDISAGTGKDFNELALIFGKARTQGTLFAEDINQLTEAGIPIIGEFAKQFGVAESEVKKLVSSGQVGFADLERAFINLTSEGGRFFDLTARQSQTVAGRISTLVGNFNGLVQSIGERLLPVIGSLVDSFGGFVTLAREFVDTPVSEQLEQERVELNLLVSELIDVNTEESRRSQIIDQLNKQYPGFLENLDIETASNSELRAELAEVNKLFIARILLQKEEERVQKALAGAAVQSSAERDAAKRVRAEINQLAADANIIFGEEITTIDQQVKVLRESNVVQSDFANQLKVLNGLVSFLDKNQRGANSALEDANKAQSDLLDLQEELAPTLEEFEKRFGSITVETEKNTVANEKNAKSADKLAEARKKLQSDVLKGQDENDRKDAELLRKTNDRLAENQKKREDAAQKDIERARQKDIAAQEEVDRIFDALDAELEANDKADEAEIAAEEAKNKKKKEEREKDLQNAKENRQKLVDISIDTANKIIDIAEQQTQAQIDQLDILLDAQRERVANAVLTAERGNAELLQAEEDRLAALTAARERAAERQRQIAAIQATANQIVAASQGIVAVTRAFAQGSFVEGIATSVALAAQVAAIIAQINQAGNQVQGFADGTDFVNGPGSTTSDSVPAMLSRGERVVPSNINSRYYDALNEFQRGTPKADMMAAMMNGGIAPTDTSKIESELVMMNQRLENLEMNVTLDSKGFSASLQKYQSNQYRKRKLT